MSNKFFLFNNESDIVLLNSIAVKYKLFVNNLPENKVTFTVMVKPFISVYTLISLL